MAISCSTEQEVCQENSRLARGGRIGHEDLAGVYAINADCSGTMTFWFTAAPDTKTNWDV